MAMALMDRTADVPVVTADQLDLIRRTIAKDATADELKLYLYDCQRQGVHPLDKLIHFTKRSGKYTPITSIDFMRIRAADSGEMAGSDDALFEDDDEHGWPIEATVTVYRLTQGQRFAYTATARWSEYKPEQNDFMWRKMPHTMLGKCAEALALRKGFPRQLAGLYAKEELEQADNAPAPAVVGTARERENPAAATGETRGNSDSVASYGGFADMVDTVTGAVSVGAKSDELPAGYHRIDDFRPDGNWFHITWGRDAQGGSVIYKTKIMKIANAARVAYNDRLPVRLECKKFPFVDAVEPLEGWTGAEAAETEAPTTLPPIDVKDIPF